MKKPATEPRSHSATQSSARPATRQQPVIGWDIGGVNTKVALVADDGALLTRQRPYELQRAPDALGSILCDLALEVGAAATSPHAVTMTAELSQMFRTKREGVNFVLDAVERSFPASLVRVYAVGGRFLTPEQARHEPLAVAAANWSATARVVAQRHRDALLIDVGTTTADVIPIVGGQVAATGSTDPDRLASGELVYTGALRTPTEAIVSHVPWNGATVGVSTESFALAGDVHLWRGDSAPADYTVPTPDGRPATREYAGERLARAICADREMVDEAAITAIAGAVACAQIARLAAAIRLVVARHPSLNVAVVTGLGSFLGAAAAREAGLRVVALANEFGDAARCAPAVSVAMLLAQSLTDGEGQRPTAAAHAIGSSGARPVTPELPGKVVKIGGGSLASVEHFDAVLATIDEAGDTDVLVVPGGGPFADAVRGVDRRMELPEDVSHWMAVLAMDQLAHLVVSRLKRGALVSEPIEIAGVLRQGRIPVLAPYQWLRRVDPLPHTWDVTSDSIAAWVASVIGAERLVLVKPPGVTGHQLVDAYFARALTREIEVTVIAADQIDALSLALRAPVGSCRT